MDAVSTDASACATVREGNRYVGESRVELYSVVASWQQGYSPEETWNGFPHLPLRDIYGAILYYLEHRETMDAFFRSVNDEAAIRKQDTEAARPVSTRRYASGRRHFARRCKTTPHQPHDWQ